MLFPRDPGYFRTDINAFQYVNFRGRNNSPTPYICFHMLCIVGHVHSQICDSLRMELFGKLSLKKYL
jgi:hypothetical protein